MICKVKLSREEAQLLKEIGDGSVLEGIHYLIDMHSVAEAQGLCTVRISQDLYDRIRELPGGFLPPWYVSEVMEAHVRLLEELQP